jgi:excisionase family DNA binding protein
MVTPKVPGAGLAGRGGGMYEDWPTLAEATNKTGISERSLHRMIANNAIRREYRREAGKKPVIILDPEQVEALTQRTVHPIATPETLPAKTTQPAKVPQADMVALLSALTEPSVPLRDKFYLTLKEAAKLSGLPQAFLLRKIKDGDIPASKVPAWRIRREDLESYRIASNGIHR